MSFLKAKPKRNLAIVAVIFVCGISIFYFIWNRARYPTASHLGIFVSQDALTSEEELFERLSPKGCEISPSDIKTLVLELSDSDGVLSFQSETAEKFNLKTIKRSKEILINLVRQLKRRGFYVIGYYQVFKNPEFARVYPGDAAQQFDGRSFTDKNALFVDPMSSNFQGYFSQMLKELSAFPVDAAFDEIMLDYIRYPEYSQLRYPYSQHVKYSGREKAITDFVSRMRSVVPPSIALSGALLRPGLMVGQNYPQLCDSFNIIRTMIYPSRETKKLPPPNVKAWRENFQGIVKLSEKMIQKGCKAKFEPVIEGFAIAEDESGRRNYISLPENQMAWQLEEVKKKGWKVIIYNSHSDFSNLYRVLGY